MRRWIVTAALWALCAAGLAAADFWQTKPYTGWSEKEVEQMLTDSPWARKLSVVMQVPPRESGDLGDGGGRGFPIAAPQLKMTLTWRSAQPVRQALARSDKSGATVIDGRPILERPPEYMLTLSNVPGYLGRSLPAAAKASFLRHGQKTAIPLLNGGIQQGRGGTLTLVLAFPRTDPITLDDKEVEFVTTLGTLEIKQKFKLKDLVVNGELEL